MRAHATGPAAGSRPAAPSRAAYRHFVALPTRWADNDVYGHVNNAVYYFYFDSVVNGYLSNAGALDYAQGPVIAVVAETGCRYHASASYPDVLDIGLAAARIGTSSIRYELAVFRPGQDRALADAHFVHVCVDRDSRRPVALPAALRAAAAAIRR